MKKLYLIILLLILTSAAINFSQDLNNRKFDINNPVLIKPISHDPNFKDFPENSFYQSREDWRHIIDSVWGPGLPLSDKLNIYNTYANTLHNKFDGFLSLGINWDSLRSYYQVKINGSTSRGGFSAILSDLTLDLRDYHTKAFDIGVTNTALNPGVPLLALSGFLTVEHFGAVVTVLPDDNVCVIRAVNNHPLSLEPGDIILGYEGISWGYLVNELQEYELPSFGSLGGALSVNYHQKLICAGMNWHLFDTIDILKYSTGDTLHLPTSLMVGFSTTQMLNNEQVAIPGISFPNYFNNQFVSYGIINNTNIGYIYLYQEYPQALVEHQFYEAVAALQNTDGLIIDMRINFGGWAFFAQAFEILFNDNHQTIEDAYRCNVNTFEMCPSGNSNIFQISNSTPEYYDRPIAVLLGPTCVSMGDLTAQRFRYHPMIRFFGKAPAASLGDNTTINTWPTFRLAYSFGDMFHVSEPGNYLNRAEFPIDYPVWHTAYDIANGKDAVVERALSWMDSLVFPHNIYVEKYFYSSGDSVHLSTIIENPNSHQLSARAYLKTVEGVTIDSVNFVKQTLKTSGEQWTADYLLPPAEEIYKVSVTVFDETALDQFTVPNATRFTTAGPVVLDSITYSKGSSNYFNIKVYVLNQGITKTITDASVRLISNDNWISTLTPKVLTLPAIPPGETVSTTSQFRAYYVDSLFPGYFNFKVEVMSNNWPYWSDSMQVVVGVEKEDLQILTYKLEQNYPNPFNPSTKISWQSPVGSQQTIKVFDVLGNEVATLVNEYKPAGKYEVEFSIYSAVGRNLSSGVYFYQLRAGEYTTVKKMLLIK